MERSRTFAIVLLIAITACSKGIAVYKNEMDADSLAMAQKKLAAQEAADTLNALQEIEAVNRDLLNERLAELKTQLEDLEDQLAKLKPTAPNSTLITSHNRLMSDLSLQIAEIEQEVKY